MHRRTVAGASAKNEIKVAIKLHIPFKICVFFLKIYFLCLGALPVCVVHVCAVLAEARRGHRILPELESQEVVSHPVSAGSRTQALCKNTKCSYLSC